MKGGGFFLRHSFKITKELVLGGDSPTIYNELQVTALNFVDHITILFPGQKRLLVFQGEAVKLFIVFERDGNLVSPITLRPTLEVIGLFD